MIFEDCLGTLTDAEQYREHMEKIRDIDARWWRRHEKSMARRSRLNQHRDNDALHHAELLRGDWG